tara:strand:+ start:26471 stop:26737 length:267 start_codon:yes stop_codon:yes gene_type:complete
MTNYTNIQDTKTSEAEQRKEIANIGTHVAIKTSKNIEIAHPRIVFGDYVSKFQLLYTIPLDREDDVFAIMERYQEDNRCNLAQANGEY